MDKRSLSERDICTRFITVAVRNARWDEMPRIREELSFTTRRIIVRGKLVSRGKSKRADYILNCKPNTPLALIEAKDNAHSIGDGMQPGLEYAALIAAVNASISVSSKNQKKRNGGTQHDAKRSHRA